MGIPWIPALKSIPWDTILANAPSILRSADALLAATKSRPASAPSRIDMQALVDRVAALEQRDRDTAELVARISTQVAALSAAVEVVEARARWLLVMVIAASVISIVACGIALFVR